MGQEDFAIQFQFQKAFIFIKCEFVHGALYLYMKEEVYIEAIYA